MLRKAIDKERAASKKAIEEERAKGQIEKRQAVKKAIKLMEAKPATAVSLAS